MSKVEEIRDEELDQVTGGVQVNQSTNTNKAFDLAQGVTATEAFNGRQGVTAAEAFNAQQDVNCGKVDQARPVGVASSPFTNKKTWFQKLFSWWPF